MSQTILELKNFRVGYGNQAVTPPIDLQLPAGIRCGIIGPNGCGKSTLLRTLLGLMPPVTGSLHWHRTVRFGYVPQQSRIDPLFPLTVDDYLKMGQMGPPNLQASINELEQITQALEMAPLKTRLVRDLSGGERQRVLLARALEQNPEVLAFDEAWSSLDIVFKAKIQALLENLRPTGSFTVFLVEHDLHRIAPLTDWLILIGSEQVVCGPKQEILTQDKLRAAFGHELPGEASK